MVGAVVVANGPIARSYLRIRLASPALGDSFVPGQFLMVRPDGREDPFLGRAYSIMGLRPTLLGRRRVPAAEILYKVVGRGTALLASLRKGDEVEVLGPLGRGFRPEEAASLHILVAGGVGVPPIVALAEALGRSTVNSQRSTSSASYGGSVDGRGTQRARQVGRRVVAIIGGKTREDVLCVRELRAAGAKVSVTTEDGSLGTRGLVTDSLVDILRGRGQGARGKAQGEGLAPVVYACGPPGMLAAVARVAVEAGVPCQVSMEANMACGFGACMGCAIRVHGALSSKGQAPGTGGGAESVMYKLCCKDGPVFDAREIVWGS